MILKKYPVWVYIVFSFLTIALMSFVVAFLFLPQKINLIQGENQKFEFNIPLIARIDESDISVISINSKPINKNVTFDFNEPFLLQSEQPGSVDIKLSLFGKIPVKTVTVSTLPKTELIPSGMAVGVKVNTEGIMVLGSGIVNGADGKAYEPGKGILKTGDSIIEINGKNVDTKEQLIKEIEKNGQDPIALKIRRNKQVIEANVTPAKSADDNKYKIGIWVRDSTQGIGTITYYNPQTNKFGALGHGILDVDTKELMAIKNGKIMNSEITSVKKGKKGVPGELIGDINAGAAFGEIQTNTRLGIYGEIKSGAKFKNKPMEIGLQQEVYEGPAKIYSNVSGTKVEEYDVEIQKINRFNGDDTKGMIIKITDERLLNQTSGIVQGMSGSPIIQNGKIIGAVTHVFVQDPSKGYGIFIENMLKQEESL